MALEKKRVQFVLFVVGVVFLSITAEKCRQMVGEKHSSQSGQFTILNCFDMGSGSIACAVKEGVKLYFYNMRSAHVERARNQAIESALVDAIGQGLSAKDAASQAQKEGAKAAKLATRQAKRIIGPIISSGWDFFEAIYYGGTLIEGFLRGTGTLVGTYTFGFHGEQRLGRFGYLVGSHLGSWVGGRIGLMVYDIANGAHFLLQVTQSEDSEANETPYVEETVASEETSDAKEAFEETSYTKEASESDYSTPEAFEASNTYEESPPDDGSETYHELR